ncbi:zinc finger, C2H2 type [Opisthorchis viverrini]|uniref:Zinc finger, C2H2 type n=1 Tax=Opisthorchis viverrini TaxID=6198 RepID=A0A1S8X1R6_OPIVI|nr:zinc finger, C2H2 type [Opisthorchis viverrini]
MCDVRLSSFTFSPNQGFHVCLCCQQTFTSPSLYDSHMLRPLARIFYRCHICRGSETAHLTSVEENPAVDLHMSVVDLLNSFGSDASSGPSAAISGGSVGPLTNTSAGTIQQQLPSHSPYCTVLFGGIVKAFNRCAVYSHFAHAHPNEVDLWTLQPSRISVCPLAESAWEPSTLELNGTDIVLATCVSGMNSTTHDGASLPQIPEPDTGRQPSSSPVSHPTSVSEPVNPVINDNLSEDGNRAAKKLDASFPYRPGVELAEVWNDLEQAINTLMASSSLAFDSRHSTVTNSPALQRIFTPTSDSSFSAASSSGPILPSPNSTLSETILHLARAPVWYSHFFLTDWSQVPSMATVSSEPESSQADQPIIDENHSQRPLENEDERDNLAEKKPKSRCIVPPPAPSNNELNDVLLNFVQHVRSSTAPMCDASSTQRPSETSIPVSTSEPSSFQSPCSKSAPTPPPEDTERGFLRCLLCSYKTNHPDHLTRHLSGSRNTVSTKCALCGQSVCVQQPALCAAKAHLLLHLGYYIMCPNCGFTVNNSKPVSLISWFAAYCVSVHHISTPFHIPRSIEQPPPHLAPDAAELCMRLHLRFVCFHFNLLQVFVCSRCQHGRGKAYNTMAHLCQHIFDSHTQRQHVCLWCARQSSNDSTAQSASTGVLRNTPGAESGSAASSTRSSDPIEHDDIHNQPSQNIVDSSSVPLSRFGPRYTTPKDLLAHVKRVHKHVLLFSSPENVMATNGQDALDQLPGDLTHGKQSQLRHSQSVRSIDSVDLTKSTNGELPITNGPTSVSAKSRGPPPDSTESDKATTGQSIHLVPAVDFTYVHSCPDCDEVFENRDTFAQHFRMMVRQTAMPSIWQDTHCRGDNGISPRISRIMVSSLE